MGIPIGKLSLYTACAGLHPRSTLPILLDVGTDNPELLAEPVYVGWRHERMRGEAYDQFIEHFVSAVSRRWPHVLLQWEDFARANAGRILARYRDRLCTFNDDIQGTAAVAAGTLLAAVNVTQRPLGEQSIVIVGAGSAGCGIAALILRVMVESGVPEAEARQRFFAVDRDGLLLQDTPGLLDFQKPFAQPQGAVADWRLEQPGRIELYDVVANAKPSVLIGVSGQPGIFSERIVRAMAAAVTRPVILPLSNPTSRAEAIPEDLMRWTDERAVIGTGSPFPPIQRKGRRMAVDQTNNAYIFPGVGLAVLAAGARRVTDGMFAAAARALAAASPAAKDPEANLLPAIPQMRSIAVDVALAVARQARNEGQCVRCDDSGLEARVRAKIWEPRYCNYRHAGAR
jgi:malate dehydrogenase (oxaloacetate-decarboxylating)